MWSNFFKKKKENMEDNAGEISAENTIQAVIEDIAKAILSCEKSLTDAQKNKDDIATIYFSHQEKSKNWYEKAMEAMKKGNENQAKNYLNEKNMADLGVKNYASIYENASENVKKLEIQLLKMNTQLVEIRTKKTILTAQLSQAKTQKEITQKLQSLQISTDEVENQISYAQAENFVEQDQLASQFNHLDDFERQIEKQNPDLNVLSKAIEEENQRKKEQDLKNQAKKFGNFFEDKNNKKTNPTEKKDAVKDFFVAQNIPEKDKKNDIDTFFTQKNNEIIPEKDTSKDNKKSDIDDFFTKKEDDKDKKINDFFSNNSK